jgi:hypothetical protein
MPITLSKIKYGTRSIVHFEALEQTLRLRLVSGPVDKKFFFSWRIACPVQYIHISLMNSQCNLLWSHKFEF